MEIIFVEESEHVPARAGMNRQPQTIGKNYQNVPAARDNRISSATKRGSGCSRTRGMNPI